MKFSCTTINLRNGLSIVAHVASKAANLPILSNILIKVERGGVKFVATNLEVAVSTLVRGKVEGEGMITAQAKLLSELVNLLPSEKIDVEVQGTDLTIITDRQQSTLRGMVADDFPVIPQVEGGIKYTIAAQELAQAIAQTAFAVNPDEGRPEISGVYMKLGPESVLAATDSYRLAERQLPSQVGEKESLVIVPLRAIQELARILSLISVDSVEVVVTESQIMWRLDDTELISRVVAGQYPDYKQIIPKTFASRAVVDRGQLLSAVRSTSLFVRSGINDVKISLEPETKKLLVAATNSQVGESAVDLPTSELSGGVQDIVFNYRYLLDGLQAITTSEVALEVVDGRNPGVLRPVGEAAGKYLYIIMPIRQ